jgi:hypothetical protein
MFMLMYCGCDRVGQLGEVVHSEGNGGERAVAILRFQSGSLRLCRLRIVSFWPR